MPQWKASNDDEVRYARRENLISEWLMSLRPRLVRPTTVKQDEPVKLAIDEEVEVRHGVEGPTFEVREK